jgi:acetylornithine deacetylase/succinyl-diaminopimelate desuccinylase-like protein
MKCTLIAIAALSVAAVPSSAQSRQHTEEIRRIADRADVRRAFGIIEQLEEQTVADHIMLTEIPAPPFMEEERAQAYAQLLRDAGADSVWIDEVGNVIALRRGAGGDQSVALDAHLDTVFPEGTDVTVRMRGDTLAAPGIADDTRGLITVLTVLRAMEGAEIETEADVLFIGTVGEEGLGDLRGVKHLFGPEGPEIDSWIAVDGTSITTNTNGALGSHRYRVTFKGPGGHSWGAFGLANPHHALGGAIDRFTRAADQFTESGERTSYNVGRIGGGTSVNSIPFESWMEVDMRSLSPERLVQIDSLLQRAIREALADQNDRRRDGEPLTVDVDMIGNRPSGSTAEDTPLIQRAIAATQFVGARSALRTGSTDSNIPISMGIPAVTIGGGGAGGNAHSLDEWWVNDQGDLGIKKALLVLVAEARLAEPVP